jgi:hypothetical protein
MSGVNREQGQRTMLSAVAAVGGVSCLYSGVFEPSPTRALVFGGGVVDRARPLDLRPSDSDERRRLLDLSLDRSRLGSRRSGEGDLLDRRRGRRSLDSERSRESRRRRRGGGERERPRERDRERGRRISGERLRGRRRVSGESSRA